MHRFFSIVFFKANFIYNNTKITNLEKKVCQNALVTGTFLLNYCQIILEKFAKFRSVWLKYLKK